MSMSHILYRDYNTDEALLVVKEINDILCNRLRKENKTTRLVYLGITYSRDYCKGFHETVLLNNEEDIPENIFNVLKYIYEKNIENLPVRKVAIAYSKLNDKKNRQLSLFDKNEIKTDEYHKIIDQINSKYGSTSILRASSLLRSSTVKNRKHFKEII